MKRFISKLWMLCICTLISAATVAQETIKGVVLDEQNAPLVGANVYWDGTQIGTSTDIDGAFELKKVDGKSILDVSYIGYTSAKITVGASDQNIEIKLKESVELQEVVISERKKGTISSRTSVLQTQKITYDEICRAACCSLAGSFETNPSVDVSYADAATGARQIKLLGLSGTYVQMLTENYPNFRGAASLFGLEYVPGAWLESIQVSKGTSSVKNGYEALAGQINVEFKKPKNGDTVAANVIGDDAGRVEGNFDSSFDINEKLATTIMAHYSKSFAQHDANDDGFLDLPLKEQVNVMNRYQYTNEDYVAQYGIRYLHENRTGGQDTKHHDFADPYQIKLKTNRAEFFTKQALIFDHTMPESVAMIVSGSYHEQKSHYDRTLYNIYQNNIYVSMMYENEFSKMHSLSTGLSLNYDGYNENLTLKGGREDFNRKETVPGAYAQYTLNLNDKLIVLAGLRADYTSMYKKLFVTPRMHIKWNPADWMHMRASIGKGYRTANVLSENNFLLSSSRQMKIADNLKQEEAWNTGVNMSFFIPLFGKELDINTEYYYTNFINQVVVDMDSDSHAVRFYNLDGKSFSHSFQVEASYPFFRGFTLTAAYRMTDSQTDYQDLDGKTFRMKKSLVSDYKGLLTASYQTKLKKWQFDLTGLFNGPGRLPNADKETPMWENTFDSYTMLNGQVTKFFRRFSIYVGGENLLNVKQANPIIDAANPRSSNFDGSMVWGPIHGRTFYAGIRFNLARSFD